MEAPDVPLRRLEAAVRRSGDQTRTRAASGLSPDEADEVVGTFATDGAIGFDPFPVLQALHRHTADVVVMGQVAGIMHGSIELTGDLDLLWDGQDTHAPRLAAAFASVEATITDADNRPLPCRADAFRLPKVHFYAPTAGGDCCTPRLPWGELDIVGIIRRAELAVDHGGLRVRFVSAADLIVMRRAVGRAKDLRRADELARLVDGR
jgi:hypothetical protein